MGLLSDNPLWEELGTRALYLASYGGADFGECFTTMQRIADGDDAAWHREWSATAERVADEAAASAARGHAVSARDGFLRAAGYHRMSYQPLYGAPVDPRLAASFEREVAALTAAAEAPADPAIQLVEIPFETGSLPGLLVTPATPHGPRPTVVHTNGYDSDLTEMYMAHAPAAVARGYNILLFDGPGQGRNLIRDAMPIRPDWENVVRPVIDWVLERPEVDPSRVVLAGWSFGGFLAPRAAAFEPRLAALVADPGQWDQRDNVLALLPLSEEQKLAFPDIDPLALAPMEEHLRDPHGNPSLRWRLLLRGPWVHGKTTLLDFLADLATFELSPVASRIACPTLLTQAEHDPLGVRAGMLFDALTVERKALVRFTAAEGAGGHCEGTARRLYHQRVYDWLEETLDRRA